MTSADIKNYSIAMEALSRVPGEEVVTLSGRIRDLLGEAIYQQERRTAPPSSTPSDDEIPF